MALFRIGCPILRIFILSIGLFSFGESSAERFVGVGGVGGFHGNIGYDNFHYNNGYHYNNIGVSGYRPGYGYGWDDRVYTAPNYIVNTGVEDLNSVNCQSVQQCDADGNCIETQNCGE